MRCKFKNLFGMTMITTLARTHFVIIPIDGQVRQIFMRRIRSEGVKLVWKCGKFDGYFKNVVSSNWTITLERARVTLPVMIGMGGRRAQGRIRSVILIFGELDKW